MIVGKTKVFVDGLEQDIHNQLHSVCKSGVGDFIHHQQEQYNVPVELDQQ